MIEKATLCTPFLLFFGLLLFASASLAEPYLAVRSGQKCVACHVNPTGGGKRTGFGVAYGLNEMPASVGDTPYIDGRVNQHLAFGANFRFNAEYRAVPDSADGSQFSTSRGSLYLQADPIPGRLTLYADHDFADSQTRELFVLAWNQEKNAYLKAGRFFLPFGYRYEDDTAFVRSVSGINMTSADDGVEAGLELDQWSVHAAISNGSNTSGDSDDGKQLSINAHRVEPGWRVGAGANHNDGRGSADKDMLAVFGATRLAGIEWLAELDWIREDNINTGEDKTGYAALLELNRLLRPGHNLKLTLEYYEPDRDVDEDEQNRLSLLWEYVPVRYLQLRVGYRQAEGIPQNPSQNTDLLFAQLHSWL